MYDKCKGVHTTVVWLDYVWLEGDEGNLEHIAEHDLTPEDVEHVIESFEAEGTNRSSGRPMRFGHTPDGRYIAVVFEWIDDETAYPVTAYEIED